MKRIGSKLKQAPSIDIAFLGPSRHGKSTLLNALAECSILPVSDIKPCTASVVSLRWASEWKMRLTFVTRRNLEKEKRQAINNAAKFVTGGRNHGLEHQMADEPQDLKSALQRFLTLYDIDADTSPETLLESVRAATLPEEIEHLLGQTAEPKSNDLANMQRLVRKYLSTDDVYWTVVDRCQIAGPFKNWDPRIHLIDLPGTNDPDPHRTAITNSLREKAKAVAICTSDGNLGPDIESWLQDSRILKEYLKAPEGSRQRLFILRTKFDAFHPEIDHQLTGGNGNETEHDLFHRAIERHKRKQTAVFHAMVRNVCSPMIPFGQTEITRRKREAMIARINSIPVFFVSALAHEVFKGRYTIGRKAKRNLSEHFNNDPCMTGIPAVRDYLNRVAEEFSTRNYYDDLERQLDTDVDLVVRGLAEMTEC